MAERGRARWASFWAEQSGPLNRSETAEHYHDYAAEMRLLLADPPAPRVLEVACGDGSLFEPMGFSQAERYLGVDLSERILEQFTARHPGIEVRQDAGERFVTDETFDLVFSSALAQFLDREQVAQHVANAASMLADGGRVVLASNPWRRLRWGYARGDLHTTSRRSFPVAVAAYAKQRVTRNMGYWHDFPDIDAAAAAAGLEARYFGSINYPYRFHAVLQRPT